MSRHLRIWMFILSMLIIVAGAAYWTFGTNHGARWAIRAIFRVLPVKVEIRDVAGCLAGRLELKEFRLHTKVWDVEIDRFTYSLQPLRSFSGSVVLKEVIFQGVVLTDKYPEVRTPLDLTWPKLPLFLMGLNGWIDSVRIKGLSYRSGQQELRLLDSLSAKATWLFGDLLLKDLLIETPFAKAEGNVQMGFNRPAFIAALKVLPNEAKGGLQSFALNLNLKGPNNQEQMSGPFYISSLSGKDEILRVAGDIGVAKHRLRFSDLRADQKNRKGKLLGTGGIDFSSAEPRLDLHISASAVDLSRELKMGTSLSGNIDLESDFTDYRGGFDLKNSGPSWKDASFAGTFEGNLRELKSLTIDGKLLSGRVKGTLRAAWSGEVSVSGSLQAREINPANITPDWKGQINVDLEGAFRWPKTNLLEGTVKANLLNSVLREKALTGKIDAQWRRGALDLARFDLHGNSFDLSASGPLQDRLTYRVQVNDLSCLIPGSKGRLTANGWAKWHDEHLSGALQARGGAISAFGVSMGEVSVETLLNSNGRELLQGKMNARNLVYGPLKIESAEAKVDGIIASHNIQVMLAWPGSGVRASFQGGFAAGLWHGVITDITSSDIGIGAYRLSEPAALKVSANYLTIGSFVLSGGSRERLEATVDLALRPIRGSVRGKWQELNIARVNGMLVSPQVSGKTSGSFEAEWPDDGSMKMTGTATIADVAMSGRTNIRLPKGETKFAWKKEGLTASWEVTVGGAGRIEGQFRSDQQPRMAMPETGQYLMSWNSLDVGMIKAWLPAGIDAEGSMAGQFKGRLLPGSRLEMTGQTKLSQGVFSWKGGQGIISAKAEEASFDIDWQNNALKGSLMVVLLNQGNLKGSFELPVSAELPVRINPQGPLRLSAKGEILEKGILTAIFPGLIGESEGQLAFDFTAGGTWQAPDLEGKIRLTKANAYLNPAGIRIHDIGAEAEFKGDRVIISSFRAGSGSGNVQGSATVFLREGRVARYEGKLRGEKFQAVYLPEIQVSANPDLSFEGDMKKVALRGTIVIPEALIRYEGKEGIISPSGDVVIVDAPKKQKKPSQMAVDMLVNVVLGDKVQIEAQGVNARLEGKALLAAQSFDRIIADGQIQAVKGQYKRRGITLDIVRGRVVFAGKAVDLAALDVLAVRKIRDPSRFNDIQAGVTVTGTLRSPLVKLYSEPAMTDADILAYMVLGKPMGTGMEGNQTSLVLQAAGTLLAKDQSTSLQSQVMKFVGIDTIDVQASGQPTSGQPTGSQPTGSQPAGTRQIGSGQLSTIQPIGSKAGTTAGTSPIASSIVTVGKYLSPDLYVAFGRSLFSNDYLATTRYSLHKHWEVEGSRRGVETGADLYYKIEFN